MANTVINTPELLNLDSTTGATVLAKGTVNERPSIPTFNADYLIIAGGGGGGGGRGGNATVWSAGGGGGGYQYSTGIKLLIDTNYTITVGAGGAGGTGNGTPISSDGENSSIVASGIINEVATGGIGGGKSQGGAGGASGSLPSNSGGTSYSAGAYWGAGGGAGIGSNGSNGSSSSGGAGGNGLQFSITGTATYYSGGGGGGIYQLNTGGSGGLGGGGNGKGTTANGDNGLVNTGGGGGGAGSTGASAGVNFTGGTGGSGIVILRYPNSYTINIGAGLTSSTITDGSEKVTSFTAGAGTITFSGATSSNSDEYPIDGTLRFNTETNKTEYFDGAGWYEIVDEYASGFIGPATNYFDTKLYTGNGGSGTSATQSIGGYINGSASFNGSSSYIDTNISTITSNAGSVSLWVKTTIGTQSAFFGGQSPSTNRFYFGVRNSNFWMGAGNTQNSYNISASSLLDGNWHHVVLTLDGSTAKYYLDGNSTPVDTISYTSGGTIGVTPLIGALDLTGTVGSYTSGSIDQVRIYNTALSASDVAALNLETAATATTAAFPSGQTAIATYTMDTSANGLLNTQDLNTVNYPAGAGCIALYEMNGNSNDTSGTYTGTANNITYQSGAFNEAIKYSGASSNIETNIANSNFTSNYSISFWVNLDNANTFQNFVGNYQSSPYGGFTFMSRDVGGGVYRFGFIWWYPTGALYNYVDNNDVVATSGAWTHLVVTKSSGSLPILYVNGTANSLNYRNSDLDYGTTTENFKIGNTLNNNYSAGLIDQVRVFNTALTQAQVTTLARGIATSYSGTATNVNFNGHLNFAPDFVWIKNILAVQDHVLTDSVRGAHYFLHSNNTEQEENNNNRIKTFDSNGFTLGNVNQVNETTMDYVAWCWKAGGTAIANNSGTIQSQVSANKDSGFSIVSYTGTGVVSDTVGHGLTNAELIFVKNRDSSTYNWIAWNPDFPANSWAYLNTQSSPVTSDNNGGIRNVNANTFGFINGAVDISAVNNSGDNYIAYVWKSITGYIDIGEYTGTGGVNTITTGFQPSWVLIKRYNTGNKWVVFDNKREITGLRARIYLNEGGGQTANSANSITLTSTGFYFDATQGGFQVNKTNLDYIYMAIA